MELKKGYKKTDVGVIPSDWDLHQVKCMGEVVTGKALAVRAPGQQRPYLRTKNVFDGCIDIDDVLTMPMTDAQFANFMLKCGDVLLNEGQSIELVGRCALYRDEYPEPCAMQNQLLRFRARPGVSGVFASHLFRFCQQTGVFARVALQTTSIAHLGGKRFERLVLAWPPTQGEQDAVGAALSDIDASLDGLEQLLTKKRDIKQAAMQQLLTGKKRLPGFKSEWKLKRLGELGVWKGGSTPSMKNSRFWDNGSIPWASSGDIKTSVIENTELQITDIAIKQSNVTVLPPKSIIVVTRSGILRRYLPVAMNSVRMAVNQDIKALIPSQEADPAFLLHLLSFLGPAILASCLKAGTTVESIDIIWFKAFEIKLPSKDEQLAIACFLSDMDAEILALEQKRDKTRHLKQGMMQELLTGRVRLPVTEAVSKEIPTTPQKTKDHNWQINEAVVISVLAKQFGSKDYPLGRKRYTKLSYLLHRHAEKQAEGYLKKAAGPYNPKTKYGGPEKIALQNGYICEHKNGNYVGFIQGDKIAQAEQYFDKWYGAEALLWLEQFCKKKNDDLELLATVDMAAEELQSQGKVVSVATVKALIDSNQEWKAKLSREVFSDKHIASAIKICQTMFG